MALPASGVISFSDLKNKLGGVNTVVKFSDYYKDSGKVYAKYMLNMPVQGQVLTMSAFRGQSPVQAFSYTGANQLVKIGRAHV